MACSTNLRRSTWIRSRRARRLTFFTSCVEARSKLRPDEVDRCRSPMAGTFAISHCRHPGRAPSKAEGAPRALELVREVQQIPPSVDVVRVESDGIRLRAEALVEHRDDRRI